MKENIQRYSRLRNKHTPTLIKFLTFFQWLRPYSRFHTAYFSSISIRYEWGYAYSFWLIFQGLLLFQSLEYAIFSIHGLSNSFLLLSIGYQKDLLVIGKYLLSIFLYFMNTRSTLDKWWIKKKDFVVIVNQSHILCNFYPKWEFCLVVSYWLT